MPRIPFFACRAALAALCAAGLHWHAAAAPVSLAPVLAPSTFTFENRGSPLMLLSPLAGSLIAMQNRSRGIELSNLLRARHLHMGEEMTRLLQAALQARGVETALLDDPPRLPGDPNTIDVARLASDDRPFVLTGVFDEVGFFSGFTSAQYKPRVNVSVYLTRCRDGETVFTHSVYYGVDASTLTEETVPADPRYAYASYDAATGRADELVQAMREGMEQIAQVMARQLVQALKEQQYPMTAQGTARP